MVDQANRQMISQVDAFLKTQSDARIKQSVGALLKEAQRYIAENKANRAKDWLTFLLYRIQSQKHLDAQVPNFLDVLPKRVYRGGQPTIEGLAWLKSQGFKTIIDFRESFEGSRALMAVSEEKKQAAKLGLRYIALPMRDHTTPTPEQIRKLLDVVRDEQNAPIYMHCAAGVGRTGIMAALVQKHIAKLPDDVIMAQAREGGLEPENWADHAVQMRYIESYCAPGQMQKAAVASRLSEHPLMRAFAQNRGVILKHTLHDTTHAAADLEEAIRHQTSYEIDGNLVRVPSGLKTRQYLINAHHPVGYWIHGKRFPGRNDPNRLHPALLMSRVLESGVFLKLDFKSPNAAEALAGMGKAIPVQQRMGHAFLKDLKHSGWRVPPWSRGEFFSLPQLIQIKRLLGADTPFMVSCWGLKVSDLTPQKLDSIAKTVKQANAQIVNFNLSKKKNPTPEQVRYLWQTHGLVCEIKIRTSEEKTFWDNQKLPYLGITDHQELATQFRVD